MLNGKHLTQDVEFKKIYNVYFFKLVHFAKLYILSITDAENIVQDVFLYILENRNSLHHVENLNAFLYTMVKNRCVDYLRKEMLTSAREYPMTALHEKELELKLYALQQFDEGNLSQTEIEDIIQNTLASLSPRCREVFTLSRFEGLRHKEIAELLDISTNTIEGHIKTALRQLRVALKEYV